MPQLTLSLPARPPARLPAYTAMSTSAEAYRRAMASAAMVDELQGELRAVLSHYRFADALRAAVQHTFRAAVTGMQAQLMAVPAAPLAGLPVRRQQGTSDDVGASGHAARAASGPSGGSHSEASQQEITSGGSGHVEVTTGTQAGCGAAGESAGGAPAAQAVCGGSCSAAAVCNGGQAPPSPHPRRTSSSGSGRGVPVSPRASLMGAASVLLDLPLPPPRPLARALKPVQAASDPLFADTRKLTAVRGFGGWWGWEEGAREPAMRASRVSLVDFVRCKAAWGAGRYMWRGVQETTRH